MVDTTIAHPDVGIAALKDESFAGPLEVAFGDMEIVTKGGYVVPQNSNIPIYSVVGIDAAAGNKVVLADPALATPIKPIGISLAPVVTGAGEETTIPIALTGHFDWKRLNYKATTAYDTDAEKAAAFEGSAAPTQIVLSTRDYFPV